MTFDHPRNVGPMLASLRCGAKTRSGGACRSPAVAGKKRCRMHGGAPGIRGAQKQPECAQAWPPHKGGHRSAQAASGVIAAISEASARYPMTAKQSEPPHLLAASVAAVQAGAQCPPLAPLRLADCSERCPLSGVDSYTAAF
jgi:hypothetical protein